MGSIFPWIVKERLWKNSVTVLRPKRSLQLWTDRFCSPTAKKDSGCFSLPVHCLPPAARMTAPMLPMTIHTIITDIEEEEGDKASPVRPQLLAAFDSAREPNKHADQ